MNETKINFSKQVILLDAAFINHTADGLRRFLSEQLSRSLPPIDLAGWLSYIALDGGIRQGDHEFQVIIVHTEGVDTLSHCTPAALREIDGQACRTPLGEFVFQCVSTAGMTDSEHLFVDLLQLALDSDNIEHLLVVANDAAYGKQVDQCLRKAFAPDHDKQALKKCKEALRFVMELPDNEPNYPYDFAGFSLMRTWGISADELSAH